MTAPGSLVRLVDDLLWRLRRDGFTISTSQAIDVLRAIDAIGVEDGHRVRSAVASIVVSRHRDRRRFDACFGSFFSPSAASGRTSWDRLRLLGFTASELDLARAWLDVRVRGPGDPSALALLLQGGGDLDRALCVSGVRQAIDEHAQLQLGYRTHQLRTYVGLDRARRDLVRLAAYLRDALGLRGEALADALASELVDVDRQLRAFVTDHYDEQATKARSRSSSARAADAPFGSLTGTQIDEVRRALRLLVQRFRGAFRVRARRAARAGIDLRRTVRTSLRTSGIPFQLVRTRRRRRDPKLVVLCDVSDSVRTAALFLLEFAFAAQDLFARSRTFVFISELGETTELFAREPISRAVDLAWRGAGVVRTTENSNYGRALRSFERRHLRELDQRTTVVILGDGRTNHAEAADDVLARVRVRVRDLVWLCTETRSQWAQGDSAMTRYAAHCSAVYEVRCAADLDRAARSVFDPQRARAARSVPGDGLVRPRSRLVI